MKNLRTRLEQFWFPIISPERLALLRIVTGLFALWYMVSRFQMMVKIAAGNARLFEPVGLTQWLSEPLPLAVFQGLLWLTIGLCVLYILGWKFRVTGPAFALIFLLLMCYRNSWSMIYHNYNGLVLHILVIGFTAAADALSIDAKHRKAASPHWHYGWPVMLISAATAVTYLLSGLAKVTGDLAWAWVDGSAMRSQVAVDALRKVMLGGGEPTLLFEWLYPHTSLFLFFGLMTMVVELGAPMALLHRKISYGWVLLTWGMHWGILFIMGIEFPYQLTGAVFLSFLPIEQWWLLGKGAVKRRFPSPVSGVPTRSVVLFDGICSFCQDTVQFILARDRTQNLDFASLQSSVGQELLRQHNIKADLSSLVLIEEGQGYLRSDAVLRIARHLSFPWRLAFVFWLVPRSWRDAAYHYFARHRYQWFGKSDACLFPSAAVRARFLDIDSLGKL